MPLTTRTHAMPSTGTRARTLSGARAVVSAILLASALAAHAVDFTFASGSYTPGTTAPEPLVAGQVLQVNAGGAKTWSGVTMTNQSGLVNANSADTLTLANGAQIFNQSVWDSKADGTLAAGAGARPTFSNGGTFRKSAGSGSTTIGAIAFVNSGTVDAQAGTIAFSGGIATFNAGTQFTGAGASVVSNDATFSGAFSSSNLTISGGSIAGNSAVLSGTAQWSGGLLAGEWSIGAGGTLTAVAGSGKTLLSSTFANAGTLRWQATDALLMQTGTSITNTGLHDITATSSITYNGGTQVTYANKAAGTLRVAAGATATIGSVAFTNDGTITANGTVNFSGGDATFNAGGTFNGTGAAAVTASASFAGSQLGTSLSLRSGIFTGTAAVVAGSAEWTGGTLAGTWDVSAGNTLAAKSGLAKVLNATTMTNHGTLSWQAGEALSMSNGATLENDATLSFLSSANVISTGGAVPHLTNKGTLSVAASKSTSIGTVAFVNETGATVDVGAGGTITFSGGNATFKSGTQFTGAGTKAITADASFAGAFTAAGLSLRGGTFAGTAAQLAGAADWTGGTLSGTWSVGAGATLTLLDGVNAKLLSAGSLQNAGTLAWKAAGMKLQNGGALVNTGTIDVQNDSSIAFNGGAATTFTNSGTMLKSGGSGTLVIASDVGFTNPGTLRADSGTIQLPDAFVNGGTLTGAATFATTGVINNGHVKPGSSVGTLNISGNFTQSTGTLDIEIGTNVVADKLVVSGTAALGGTLALACVAPCALEDNDVLVLLSAAGGTTGTFTNVTTTGFPASFAYQVQYDGQGNVKLVVTKGTTIRNVLDVDGNGGFDALTDGILVVRYLFGLTGPALTSGNVIANGATRTTPAAVLTRLDTVRSMLDIDGNGDVDALSDGLMIVRYLMGLRGPSLTGNAVGAGATRADAAAIEPYIATLMQ